MNRRDTTLIAHLDHIHGLIDARFNNLDTRLEQRFDRVDQAIAQLREDVAGIKLELATHHHEDES